MPAAKNRSTAIRRRHLGAACLLLLLAATAGLAAQLDETCTASILNRSVQVNPDGSFVIPNVPADEALYRVFVVCTPAGAPRRIGQSGFFLLESGQTLVPEIDLTSLQPSPTSLVLATPSPMLDATGATTPVQVTCSYPDGASRDCTSPGRGTTYNTSNPAICTIDAAGTVTAAGSGSCLVTAINQGVVGTLFLTVQVSADADGDGLPNDYEAIAPCLDGTIDDAGNDPDGDGLTSAEEFAVGTDPCLADTDADGLDDGEEIALGTDPLRADTDLDGIDDGTEVANGSDPLSADADGDGLPDGVESALGCVSPNDPDTDGDGTLDGLEDCDMDNLLNADELALGTDPGNPDTDGGGRTDGDEVFVDGTDPLDPTDDAGGDTTLPIDLFDGDGFLWDIRGDGNISNGSSDAYDGGLRLFVNDANFPSQQDARLEDAGREVVIGPVAMGQLLVSRKIFVPTDDGFARFLEVLDNPTDTPLTTQVRLETNLGSDSDTRILTTSSGDARFTPEDDFILTDDDPGAGDPTMVHAISGSNAAVRASETFATQGDDDLDWTYEVTVPAGSRVILMHFASQNQNRDAADATAADLSTLAGSTQSGLGSAEGLQIVNFVVPDADGDGLRDADELALGTDPQNPDSDGDGLLDGFEVTNGFDPLVAGEESLDTDGDGLDNLGEQEAGTSPLSQDTDLDGLSDGAELTIHGTDPLDADSDDDGLLDGEEVNTFGTNPNDLDTDGSGRLDGEEVLSDGTDPLNPEDDLPTTLGSSNDLFDGDGFEWDLRGDGEVSDGTNDAFDGAYELDVNGNSYPFASQITAENGRRELVYPVQTLGGLEVQRKIFVPLDDAFARFLEILVNPTGQDIQATVTLDSNLGSDSDTRILATSSGDLVVDENDNWQISDDETAGEDPEVTHVFSGRFTEVEPTSVSLTDGDDDATVRFDVTVPAGERVILMHFSRQSYDLGDIAEADRILFLQGRTLFGMTREEQEDVVNFFAFPDSDGDGLVDEEEPGLGTDPNDPDTDDDGLLDGEETRLGTDPLVPDSTPPTVELTVPGEGQVLIHGEQIELEADATDDGRIVSVEFLVDGQSVGVATEPPYTASFTVPDAISLLEVEAVATDTNGNQAATGDLPFDVEPDPGTTVVGSAVDSLGMPAMDAAVRVRFRNGTEVAGRTASDGTFSVPDVPTIFGDLRVVVDYAPPGREAESGRSAPAAPVRAGVTDVGSITLRKASLVPFTDTGDLWILEDACDCILRVTPEGSVTVEVTAAEIQAVTGESPDMDDTAAAFDSFGTLYFVDDGSDSVLRRDPDGTLTRILSRDQIGTLTGFGDAEPLGLTLGDDGALYITEQLTSSVLRIDLTTGTPEVFVTEADILALPEVSDVLLDVALVAGENGVLHFALRSFPPLIVEANADGDLAVLAANLPFFDIRYMTRDADGNLYLAGQSSDCGGDRGCIDTPEEAVRDIRGGSIATVVRITLEGDVSTFLTATPELFPGLGGFPELDGGIAFDDSGRLYLVDDTSDVLLRVDAEGVGEVLVSAEEILAVTGFSPDLDGGVAFAPGAAASSPVPLAPNPTSDRSDATSAASSRAVGGRAVTPDRTDEEDPD